MNSVAMTRKVLSALSDGSASTKELHSLCDCEDRHDRELLVLVLTRLREAGSVVRDTLYVDWKWRLPGNEASKYMDPRECVYAHLKLNGISSAKAIRHATALPLSKVNSALRNLELGEYVERYGKTVEGHQKTLLWARTDKPYESAARGPLPAGGLNSESRNIVPQRDRAFRDWLAEDARGCIQPPFRPWRCIVSSPESEL